MRRFPFALAIVLAFSTWAPTAAGEDDAVVEAVRVLMGGSSPTARDRAETVVRADPAAAVRAFIDATRIRVISGVDLGSSPVPADRVGAVTSVADAEPVTQIYDVRDLTQGALSADELAERLRSLVDGTMSIEATQAGVLSVRASAASLAATGEILDRLRTRDQPLYEIDARLIMAPMTSTVGTQVLRARAGEVVELDEPLARVEEWERGADIEILASPTISCMPGQRGSLRAGRQISYISDFDVEVAQSAFICDPLVDVIWDGVQAEFAAWPDGEGGVELSLAVAISDVDERMATFQTSLGALTDPISIEFPSYVKTEMSRSLHVADGGSVLVRLADGPDARRMILLTVRALTLTTTETAEGDRD